ncbi:unnamed protein product [Rhizoctonia solani]|uniref:Protein kinase domain-containing protein n=1 Tax=Rhizoctonia solani TaxID=456999 RepID=A0A8H2XY34_9AGAM|nr:unnamed protein product [Rhizoctonia solani]
MLGYFHTPSGTHYFDYRWNVFSQDGKLIHSPSTTNSGGLLPITFCIDGAVYWFDMDILWCQVPSNELYRIHTWQSELNEDLASEKHYFYASDRFYYLDNHLDLRSEGGKRLCKGSLSFMTDELSIPNFYIDTVPFWLHKDGILSRGIDKTLCRVLAWPRDSCPTNAKSELLQKEILGGSVPCPLSPSILNSSIFSSTTDNCQTPDTSPLFLENQPQGAPIAPAQYNTPGKAKVQSIRKRANKDRLTCPYCEKEHIRAHQKDKSQVCPFVDPNTGIACDTEFCTKQNMRRHFSTHRVGTLEEYLGLPPLPLRKTRQNTTLRLDTHIPYNPYLSGATNPRHSPSLKTKEKTPSSPSNSKTAHNIKFRVLQAELTTPEDFDGSHLILPGSPRGLAESVYGDMQPRGLEPLELEDTTDLTAFTPKTIVGLYQGSRVPTPEDYDTTQIQEDAAVARPSKELKVDTKCNFYASGRFCYLDEYRRVYSEDGTVIHDSSPDFEVDERSSSTFYIDEEPYWFNQDTLMTQDADGAQTCVHTWQSGTEIISCHMTMHEMFHHLLHHGCLDLSSQMDAQQDTAIIINGGGFGDIWLGRLNSGVQVAIKAWRSSIIEQCDYKILKRATREIYFWSKLKHENIQPLMGIIVFKGHYLGMVSQWMENGNLHGYMRKNPDFDRHRMSVQVASGLAYMHEHDAVHGDLKALNLLVSLDGVARLTDFGLSTMSEAGLAFSQTTTTQARTIRWASPEQLLEDSPSSKQSDVYALGMTILVRQVNG